MTKIKNRFVDENPSGELSQHEMCAQQMQERMDLALGPERVELVRQVLSSIWPLFVGNEEEMCDEESFVRLGGRKIFVCTK